MVQQEITELLELDYEEIEHDKEQRKLNPHWDMYSQIESLGRLYIFTARDKGTLVGYFTVVVHEDLHDKDRLCASQDIIFLKKEYRKGYTGIKLIRFGEGCLREDGLSHLVVTTTMKNPIGPLMKRLGYTLIEEKFERKF